MSSYNNLPGSNFVPNEDQMALMLEYVKRYGPLTGFLPNGASNTDPEYVDLFQRMQSAGFVPSTQGWVPPGIFAAKD